MNSDPAAAAAPATSDGASIRERHPSYFFAMAVFDVEGTLFHVPKDGFISLDPKFFDRFHDLGHEDATEETPIEIKDTTAEYFHGLLLVLYPFRRTAETYGEWLGALDLATKWGLSDVREKAIAALSTHHETSSTSQIEVVLLAKRYRIKPWLRNAYANLVKQEDISAESLHQEGQNHLDWETVARLLSVRVKLSRWPSAALNSRLKCSWCSSGLVGNCQFNCKVSGYQIPLEQVLGEVDITFRSEFEAMGALNDVDESFPPSFPVDEPEGALDDPWDYPGPVLKKKKKRGAK